jgi:hypothetical protein
VHEIGLCVGIVDAAVRRAAGRPVTVVRVRVGGHPVDRDVIEAGFRMVAAGTEVEGAELDVVVVPDMGDEAVLESITLAPPGQPASPAGRPREPGNDVTVLGHGRAGGGAQ